MAREYKQITVWCRDQENSLEDLLKHIKATGNTGHSFSIIVDPANSGTRKVFEWDGDGADQIGKIRVQLADNMQKAVERGGKYVKRIPKPGGGYHYIYDEKKYAQRKDAHISGSDAAKTYITHRVERLLESQKSFHPKELEGLVKRYGVKAVAGVLDEHHKAGKIELKKGKIVVKAKKGGKK